MNTTLQNIIVQGESETLEFKTSFSDEVIVSLVAFANTKGGMVCVGILDSGEIKGVSLGKETVRGFIAYRIFVRNIVLYLLFLRKCLTVFGW